MNETGRESLVTMQLEDNREDFSASVELVSIQFDVVLISSIFPFHQIVKVIYEYGFQYKLSIKKIYLGFISVNKQLVSMLYK
jgi:hypothetical protein